MARSVTEAQNHDEGRGGRSVTGIHRSALGIQNKSVTEGTEKQVGIKCNRCMALWFATLYVVFSGMECSYKLNYQPVCEQVTGVE